MTESSAISRLIGQARRRTVLQLILDQFLWGATAGLAAFLVLLLVGTQVLNWYWPLLILVLTAAVLWFRSRGRMPGEYEIAQRLDAYLGLRDLLSTAYNYLHSPRAAKADARFVTCVTVQAEEAAAAAGDRIAIPIRTPRSAWPALVMLVLAASTFTVRYGVLHTFNLQAPIAEVRFDTLTGAPQPKRAPAELAKTNLPTPYSLSIPDGDHTAVTEKDNAIQESLRSVDVNDPTQVTSQGKSGDRKSASQSEEESEEGADAGEKSSEGNAQAPTGAEGNNAARQDPGDKRKQAPPPKDSSLMDKMRDALANLMDKLKMEPQGEQGKQMSSGKSGQKAQGQQKSNKGTPMPGKPNQPGDPDSSQPGDQPGESDSTQQAKTNQSGDSKDQPSNQEKSGIGRQDGRKDTELAEQRNAMGKLSELLGKRSLNTQGEVMVEVTNSKNQQLKTPYVTRSATHTDAGSDVNRDEVPLHLQDFVQRYYQNVRKTPAPITARP